MVKQQHCILKEIMINKKLLKAIYRSEYAYNEYVKDKFFFQAIRIYNANKVIYSLLQDYLLVCNEVHEHAVCTYLFHLEDWTYQFETVSLNVKPNDVFVFERWVGGVEFPKDFVLFLKSSL